MSKRRVTRVVAATPSTHKLSVGPLRETPVGALTMEQLESAETLIELEQQKAEATGDELRLTRLGDDAFEVKAELERRNLSAA